MHFETDNQHAKPLVWTKAEMYQRRVKGCGISQPSSGLPWLPLASRSQSNRTAERPLEASLGQKAPHRHHDTLPEHPPPCQ